MVIPAFRTRVLSTLPPTTSIYDQILQPPLLARLAECRWESLILRAHPESIPERLTSAAIRENERTSVCRRCDSDSVAPVQQEIAKRCRSGQARGCSRPNWNRSCPEKCVIRQASICLRDQAKELAPENERKAYSTKKCYAEYLKHWIVPRWGQYSLARIENGIAVHVEGWLDTVQRSRGTKAKIRNIMSAVCTHAIRYSWMKMNRSVQYAKAPNANGVRSHWWLRNCKGSLPNSDYVKAL